MRLGPGAEYAGLGRRAAAALLDVAVVLALAVAAVLAESVAGAGTAPEGGGPLALHPLGVAVLPLAQALAWTLLRGTPGMLLMGCLVLDETTGARLPLGRSALRAGALWLGLLALGLGVLWILKDPRRRAWHDIVAGSVVVREDESLVELDELVEDTR